MQTKVCSKCGAIKALDAFHKRADSKDGRRGTCKECDHPRLYAASKKYAGLHPAKKSESFKAWYARNAEQQRERNKTYYLENFDALRERRLARYWADPEKYRAKSIESAKNHRERVNERRRKWIKTRPDVRAKADAAGLRSSKKARDALADSYVKQVLAVNGLPRDQIPRSLIEAKRVQLQIKRLLREKTK